MRTEMKKMTAEEVEAKKFALFERFISSLGK
jgi:hypothetical protein